MSNEIIELYILQILSHLERLGVMVLDSPWLINQGIGGVAYLDDSYGCYLRVGQTEDRKEYLRVLAHEATHVLQYIRTLKGDGSRLISLPLHIEVCKTLYVRGLGLANPAAGYKESRWEMEMEAYYLQDHPEKLIEILQGETPPTWKVEGSSDAAFNLLEKRGESHVRKVKATIAVALTLAIGLGAVSSDKVISLGLEQVAQVLKK